MKVFICLLFIFIISCNNTVTNTIKKCSNECISKGIECDISDNSVYNCRIDKNGCYKKELIEKCQSNESCIIGNECLVKNCTDECNFIGYFCEDDKRYECGNFDDDSCFEKRDAFCRENFKCFNNGECINPNECVPTEEKCDGLDNDCDGIVDNNLVAPNADKQSGICNNSKKVCNGVNGWHEPDYTQITDYMEKDNNCDGIDNDCDGNADEDFVKQTISCGVGVCLNNGGVRTCFNGNITTDCKELIENKTEEKCDGLDNDCDGIVDNNLVAPNADKQSGICNNSKKVCNGVNGWHEPDYTQITDYMEKDNNCDGIDNDCDGNADEDFVNIPISCGVGECVNQGFRKCIVGELITDCTPLSGSEEICDGEDNNCDGNVDEGFDKDGDGVADCIDNCPYTKNFNQNDNDNDNLGNVCDCFPNKGNLAIKEVCNGADDNCNGLVDEGHVCDYDNDCVQMVYHNESDISNNHNYIFCSSNSFKKTWNQARKYCNSKNYNLVTIETEAENTWIRSNITSNHWIGLNDIRVYNIWESGFGRVWNTNNDDSYQDCWEVRPNDPLWHDKGCGDLRNFICEESFNLPTTPSLATSCKQIKTRADAEGRLVNSGNYYINLGTVAEPKPQLVICDMDTDGGGWTLVASWYYDYNWTKSHNSKSHYFGMCTQDTVSSNFGNMIINDFRVIATENLAFRGLKRYDDNGNSIGATGADWYYHYNTPLKWKKIWAPQAHNSHNQDDCTNGWISTNPDKSRQSLKQFDYSYNIKFDYFNSNHHWNNLSDWSAVYMNGRSQPYTCDRIADYWGALTQDGIEFTVYNNSNENHDPVEDGTLGIPIKGNNTDITGQDISTNYSARVGYDDNHKSACYGLNSTDVSTDNDNTNDNTNSTKLWWFIR